MDTRQAAAFKGNGYISYGDCFAAALAKARKAELVTGDQDFLGVEEAFIFERIAFQKPECPFNRVE